MPCPGCGLTKSIIHIYRGNFDIAMHYNVWGFVYIFMCIAVAGTTLYDIFLHSTVTERLFDYTPFWQSIAICVWLTFIIRLMNALF